MMAALPGPIGSPVLARSAKARARKVTPMSARDSSGESECRGFRYFL
jgi:hypothetical protein